MKIFLNIPNTSFWKFFLKYIIILTTLSGVGSFVIMVIAIIGQEWNLALIGFLLSILMTFLSLVFYHQLRFLGIKKHGQS